MCYPNKAVTTFHIMWITHYDVSEFLHDLFLHYVVLEIGYMVL